MWSFRRRDVLVWLKLHFCSFSVAFSWCKVGSLLPIRVLVIVYGTFDVAIGMCVHQRYLYVGDTSYM